VIIGREIAISALREWMAGIGQHAALAVSSLGKLKTILQMVGLTLLLIRQPLLGVPLYTLGVWLTMIAAALTLISMGVYLRSAWPHLSARG
jgi:phosphatidylglycerophosphate synthase